MAVTEQIQFRPRVRPEGDATLFHSAASAMRDRSAVVDRRPIARPEHNSVLTLITATLVLAALCAATLLMANTVRSRRTAPEASPTPRPAGQFAVSVGPGRGSPTPSHFHMATVEIASRQAAHGKLKQIVSKGPALMKGAKRNAVAAASACLGRPVRARIDSGNVLGASGGLLFALAIVDELTPGDLTGGRDVTGTGAISATGRVGPVLEIDRKVKTARRSGADLFLVPYEQLAAAKAVAGPMGVAGVRDLGHALTILTGGGCGAHASRA